MLIDFCLPVKNEERILRDNALKLKDFLAGIKPDYGWRIVIIVNGSNDASFSIAQNLASDYPDLFLARVLPSGGKGLALKAYFQESPADILAFMDIDLAVSLENIPSLLEPILKDEADLAIGSRLLSGSRTDRSWWRGLSSQGYNYLARLFFNHGVHDLQCGFKAMKRDLFHRLYDYFLDDKWFFDTELIVFASRLGYRIVEVPVDWEESRYAVRKSKIKVLSDGCLFLRNLFGLRKRLRTIKKYPDNV
jgi:glycosyltransferase involved in cell wall biosynthesis